MNLEWFTVHLGKITKKYYFILQTMMSHLRIYILFKYSKVYLNYSNTDTNTDGQVQG